MDTPFHVASQKRVDNYYGTNYNHREGCPLLGGLKMCFLERLSSSQKVPYGGGFTDCGPFIQIPHSDYIYSQLYSFIMSCHASHYFAHSPSSSAINTVALLGSVTELDETRIRSNLSIGSGRVSLLIRIS